MQYIAHLILNIDFTQRLEYNVFREIISFETKGKVMNLNTGILFNKPIEGFAIFAIMFAVLFAAYLLGSINSAILISKLVYHDDIRKHGSGNGGLTNMLRTYGGKAAILTLIGDVLKTAIAIIIAVSSIDLSFIFVIQHKPRFKQIVSCHLVCDLINRACNKHRVNTTLDTPLFYFKVHLPHSVGYWCDIGGGVR